MGGFSKKEKLAYVRAKKHLLHKKVIAPATTADYAYGGTLYDGGVEKRIRDERNVYVTKNHHTHGTGYSRVWDHYSLPTETVFSSKGGGSSPQDLLMRSGDVERNPGPQQSQADAIKSVQIIWEDGRTSWVKPYRISGNSMDIGTKVRVKWGKKKRFFPGSIGGIEYLNNYHANSPMTVFSDNQSQHSCSLSSSVNDTP